MTPEAYLGHIKAKLHPTMYPVLVQADEVHFLLRDGRYLFYCLPVEQVDLTDTKSAIVKRRLAKLFRAIPVIREFGLFLHIYGPVSRWLEPSKNVTVDKTALRPVIVQNVNFIDPDAGDVYNNRTSWGPVQFGFCGRVIEVIESVANEIKNRG